MADVHGISSMVPLFATGARTATANGTGVDITQYDGTVKIILDSAAGTGTTPTLDVKIQDSANDSTYADLSPALAFTQVTTAASLQSIGLSINNVRQYIRAVATITGTTPSFTFSCNVVAPRQYV